MRVLVAGATGVIGRQLLPALDRAGHEPIALARTPERGSEMEHTGVEVVIGDALDEEQLRRAVEEARPDGVVHALTAIPHDLRPRRMAKDFELTNRLRTEGTAHLLAAARAAGVRRVVAEGVAFAYDPSGEGAADEDEPLWRDPPRQFASALAALRDLEEQVLGYGGRVLRLGHLYGPGSAFAPDGALAQKIRKAKMPQVGDGTAVFSFLHAQDAASAFTAALEQGETGVLNVVDDDPAPVSAWLPHLAGLLDAPAPTQVPKAMARLMTGQWGVDFMTRLRGADNTRARVELGWEPRFRSWRDGFAAELTGAGTQSGWTG